MTSKQQQGLSFERIRGPSEVNVDHLECPICQEVLWKPVACQTCETPFCLACINRWLADNPNKCPIRCETYTERKCPPFIIKLLAQLQISCFYRSKGCEQVISYEALDKHEDECDYQSQQCPGCRSRILKKDFTNHKSSCALIELTCPDCRLVYKIGDTATKHTENICLREQLRQVRDESKENRRVIQELIHQLNDMRTLQRSLLTKVTIMFDDLPNAIEDTKYIPDIYKRLKWNKISYMHELYAIKNRSNSGYVSAFTVGGSPHIAYFSEEGSISVEHLNETFTFISLVACAAWNDDLQLIITGYRNSTQINIRTPILLFGQPQLIVLQWKNIDRVVFTSSGGTPHPGGRDAGGSQVVLTQLTISQLD